MNGQTDFTLILNEEIDFTIVYAIIMDWPWSVLYTLGYHDPATLGSLDTQTLGEMYGELKE